MAHIFLLALGMACQPAPAPTASEAVRVVVEATVDTQNYTTILAKLDQELAGMERTVSERPTEWLLEDRRAIALLRRARLTGDYGDFTRAEAAVEAAFAKAPEGAGPFLTRASLNHALHRLDRIAADLAATESAVLVSDNTQSSIVAMRANLLLQRGHPRAAEALYREALALHRTSSGLGALGVCLGQLEQWEAAEAALVEAAGNYHSLSPVPLAWNALQRGVLDLKRDQLDAALVHFQEALKILPGWWSAEARVAGLAVLQGRNDEALTIYEDLVARIGLPEFMDAIAGILTRQGDVEGARTWTLRAREIYERQLVMFPEAAAGHAVQHFLDAGDSGERAVALAEANVAMRPNAEALTLLAEAYFGVGRQADALAAMSRAKAAN